MNIYILLINLTILLGTVLYIISIHLQENRDFYLEKNYNEKLRKKNKDFKNLKKFMIFKWNYEKLLLEKKALYKISNNKIELEYFRAFVFSFLTSLFLSLNFWIMGEIFLGFLLFVLIYTFCNFLYLKFLKRKMEKYKTVLSSEAIGVMQQFGIYYAYMKNPIRVLKDILIPKNKKREISRQLEKLLENIVHSPQKTPVEVISKFKKTVNGVIGLEIFLTLLQNTIEQGVISEKEITAYSQNLIKQKKMAKEKKIKETISLLEIILIIFFIIPISIILMLPTLLQKNGDFNLLDLIKAIVKF